MSLETIGSYSIVELLARGGMAEVFLAVTSGDWPLRKQVAIKRILRQFNQSNKFLQMFHDEAKLAIQLRHKNIVTVFDYGIDRGHPYIVMEFVPGQSLHGLKKKLTDQKVYLPFEHWLFLLKEIASGLAYAHTLNDQETGQPLNLIHRDITPQNILFGSHGNVKIIDFGVARSDMNSNATQVGTIKGKYGYLSPEQLEVTKLDARSDLFSMGVSFWELLFNRKLFQFNVEVEYFAQIKSYKWCEEMLSERQVPVAIADIIRKLLQQNREDRYASAEAVLKDANLALNTFYPEYTEIEFSKFVEEWLPLSAVSFSQKTKLLQRTERLSKVTIRKHFNFRLPKGLES
jgi:serine/threonine protein kinase